LSAAFASNRANPYQPSGKAADFSLAFGNCHQLFEIVHMLITVLDRP
jgi:hypothetical protein